MASKMAGSTRKKAADDLGNLIKELGDIPSGLDVMLGATANPLVAPPLTSESPSNGTKPKPQRKTKYPCGKCDAEVTGNSGCYNSCELWFHSGCVDASMA